MLIGAFLGTSMAMMLKVALPTAYSQAVQLVTGIDLVTIEDPPEDDAITFPLAWERKPGELVDLKAREGSGPVSWAILAPEKFRAARRVDDATLVITMPAEKVIILADFGRNSQLLVIEPEGVEPLPPVPPPDPPTPDPPDPGPEPSPDPPLPDVPDTYHVGKASYAAAVAVVSQSKAAEARAIAAVFKSLAERLKKRELTVYDTERNGKPVKGAWSLVWEQVRATQPMWTAWEATARKAIRESADAGTIGSHEDWIGAFEEVATALEAVK